MKIKDIIYEGLWDDLRAIGRQSQAAQAAATKAGLGRRLSAIKGKLTPKFYSDFADKMSTMRKSQDLERLADSWAQGWEQQFKTLEKSRGQAMSDDEYRGNFRSWLEKTSKVRVAPAPVSQYINVQSTQAVKDYFLNHFIPQYQKIQSNPVFVIPDGTVVNVETRAGSKVTQEPYTWSANDGHWFDSSRNEVPAFSNLHNTLTADAMDRAAGTTGGGNAPTV